MAAEWAMERALRIRTVYEQTPSARYVDLIATTLEQVRRETIEECAGRLDARATSHRREAARFRQFENFGEAEFHRSAARDFEIKAVIVRALLLKEEAKDVSGHAKFFKEVPDAR